MTAVAFLLVSDDRHRSKHALALVLGDRHPARGRCDPVVVANNAGVVAAAVESAPVVLAIRRNAHASFVVHQNHTLYLRLVSELANRSVQQMRLP